MNRWPLFGREWTWKCQSFPPSIQYYTILSIFIFKIHKRILQKTFMPSKLHTTKISIDNNTLFHCVPSYNCDAFSIFVDYHSILIIARGSYLSCIYHVQSLTWRLSYRLTFCFDHNTKLVADGLIIAFKQIHTITHLPKYNLCREILINLVDWKVLDTFKRHSMYLLGFVQNLMGI